MSFTRAWGSAAAAVFALLIDIGVPLAQTTIPAAAAPAVTCNTLAPTIVGTSGDDTLLGTPGDDVIVGLGGNDTIRGFGGADRICGGDGNDTIEGSEGLDVLNGGPGNDRIVGGPDADIVSYEDAPSAVQVNLAAGTASGGDGSDTLAAIEAVEGSPGDDQLIGDNNDNELATGGGSDILVGLGGSDGLEDQGAAGSRVIFLGGAGNDRLFGGLGEDVVDYLNADGVTVDLPGLSGRSAAEGVDDLFGIEDVLGSPGSDTIIGDGKANVIAAEGGNDHIAGMGGNDTLVGGSGNDTLDGGTGTDVVSFGASPMPVVASLATDKASGDGNDTLASIESLIGSPTADRLTGGPGNDTIDGGLGNDVLDGGAGTDMLSFDSGSAAVTADLKSGTATGQGTDTLLHFENVRGSHGDVADVLRGDDKPNRLIAGRGDTLEGRGGNDVLDGITDDGSTPITISYASATGPVTVDVDTGKATGAAGTDTIRFAPNRVVGSTFDDHLSCTTSATITCTLDGRGGNDTLTGGRDLSLLRGGPGNDRISGRGPNDVALFDLGGPVNANLTTGRATGQGTDTLTGIEGAVGSPGKDVLVGAKVGRCNLDGAAGDDQLSAPITCALIGGPGNDTITGSPAGDFVDPGPGNDTVKAGGGGDVVAAHEDDGNDSFTGGAGRDVVSYAEVTKDLHADLAVGSVTGAGTDTVVGFEQFISGSGNDSLVGTEGPDMISGGLGDDTIAGTGGDDVLSGDNGNDTIHGGDGNDRISGGYGDDALFGDGGTNTIDGGPGNDTCDQVCTQ